MHEKRFYRDWVKNEGLISFEVKVFETDILFFCDKMLKEEAERLVYAYRGELLKHFDRNAFFKDSILPVDADETAHDMIKDMIRHSAAAGVGPMAGVAGAIAQYTGRALLGHCSEIIVENGGDIFIKRDTEVRLGIYAGNSPLSGKIGLRIGPDEMPVGVCTSSGTVGHSRSFGIADAATIISPDAILADCVATQTGNLVKNADDMKRAIDYARSIDGVKGALVIVGDKIATWGDIELV